MLKTCMNKMKTSLANTLKADNKFSRARMTLATILGVIGAFFLNSQVVFAAADSNVVSIATMIFKVLGAIGIIGGLIMGIMGIMAYAEAKSEGEGPAMSKAKNQVIGAIILLAVGGAIFGTSGTLANTVANIDIMS